MRNVNLQTIAEKYWLNVDSWNEEFDVKWKKSRQMA